MKMSLPKSWQTWGNAALSFVYPEVCQLCGSARATPGSGFVCHECRAAVKKIEKPFCSKCGRPYFGAITTDFVCNQCEQAQHRFCWARSAVIAKGPLLDAIHRYKYSRQLWFEVFFGALLIEAAAETLRAGTWDALVPVPLFPVKEREREFNQAERLASLLSNGTSIPVDARLIKRVVPTQSQTTLSRVERAENVRGAFRLRGKTDLKGKNFVLIDDVFTTGATTDACARVLIKGGAASVAVWTLARGV